MTGIRGGWAGLLHFDAESTAPQDRWAGPLGREQVRTIERFGGTALHTSRTNPSKVRPDDVPQAARARGGAIAQGETFDCTPHVLRTIEALGIDALVPIGGDDTLSYAARLSHEGVPVVSIPKTMDNDVFGTDYCIGFSTAVTRSTECIDALRSSAGSHERELLLQGAVQQEGQRGDEDVGLHPLVGLMVDGPHVDDVLEVSEAALDLAEFLVEAHDIDRRQAHPFALDDVLALAGELALEVEGMLEVAEDAVLIAPIPIALAVVAGQDAAGGGADLVRRLEPALGDASGQGLELPGDLGHGLLALCLLEGQALVRVHHQDACPGRVALDLAHQGLGRILLLSAIDGERALVPRPGGAGDVAGHFGAAAPVAAEDVALTVRPQQGCRA